jgi:hypothetical protein
MSEALIRFSSFLLSSFDETINKSSTYYQKNNQDSFTFYISVAAMTGAPYSYSFIFKYIIIGDMGVGKCSSKTFTFFYLMTVIENIRQVLFAAPVHREEVYGFVSTHHRG